AVLLTTFTLTIVFDLTLAVQIGVVLAAFLFMKRMADVTRVGSITRELADPHFDWDGERKSDRGVARPRSIPAGVPGYEVNGAFFLGAADKVRDVLNVVEGTPRVVILRMRHVPVLDATGLHMLEEVHKNCQKAGTALILSGLRDQPLQTLRRSPCLHEIGKEN